METNKDSRISRLKLHYAWVVAFAGLLITGTGIGIFNSCNGVFIKPVCEELGFERSEFTLYVSLSSIVCVVLMPLFGNLFNRFGFRKIAFTGSAVTGLVLIGCSFSSTLWQFYVLGLISGIFINGIGVMAVGILINKWFIDKKGIATAIAYCGSGLFAAFVIPISNSIVESAGWRWGYSFQGIFALCVLLPVIAFVVRDKPEDVGLKPYRTVQKGEQENPSALPTPEGMRGLTYGQALRSASFWFLAFSMLFITMGQTGPHGQTVAFLSDVGYPTPYVSAVSSGYMILLTVSKLVLGTVLDKLGSLKGSLLICLCYVLFPIAALLVALPAMPWVYALLLSVVSSGPTILGTILTADYCGRRDFSKIFSIVSMFCYTGVALSSPLFGKVYDIQGSYDLAWYLIIGLALLITVCLLGAYKMKKKFA